MDRSPKRELRSKMMTGKGHGMCLLSAYQPTHRHELPYRQLHSFPHTDMQSAPTIQMPSSNGALVTSHCPASSAILKQLAFRHCLLSEVITDYFLLRIKYYEV